MWVSSLYNDFGVSGSVFDIFWGREGRTLLRQFHVKHGLRGHMSLVNGRLFTFFGSDECYSNYPSELPFDRFDDGCKISELVEHNITDLLIIRFPFLDITQILTDLIDIKTCFKVYNISESLEMNNSVFNKSLFENLKTNMILYNDFIYPDDDVFKPIHNIIKKL